MKFKLALLLLLRLDGSTPFPSTKKMKELQRFTQGHRMRSGWKSKAPQLVFPFITPCTPHLFRLIKYSCYLYSPPPSIIQIELGFFHELNNILYYH